MASSTIQEQHITPPSTTTHQNEVESNLPPQLNTNNINININNNNNYNPKKRSLDHLYLLQSSPYFKIRTLLHDLRPLFLQVIRAPDFQNCEAASKIQEKMKLMVEICRVPVDVAHEKQGGSQKFTDQKPQEKRFSSELNFEKPMQGSIRVPGTYIVGGSAFGWNFITFHGTKPVYYGRTKEAFRAGK